MAWNVVIAGGGFGGFYAARTLAASMSSSSVTWVAADVGGWTPT